MTANRPELNYTEQGSGPSVVLIHGMAASLYDWEALAPALAGEGYHTLAVDLLGHGDSHKPEDPRAYTLESLYASLEEWVEHLDAPPPYHLVGHSLGGYLSLQLAIRQAKKVRSLALISPLYSPSQLSPVLRLFRHRPNLGVHALQRVPLAVIERLLAWDPINLSGFSPQARRQIAIDYKRASPHILNIAGQLPDLTRELSRVRVPCQVIWGEKDLTLRPSSFPRLVARLPDATSHPIPRCGHQPHIGRPGEVNWLIVNFFHDQESLSRQSMAPYTATDATQSQNHVIQG
jgi:abhydrolase domain-containing protein 6